ncbi:hypothetical protein TcCL_Unassigned03236, partial [Trypanosoma cruzi]
YHTLSLINNLPSTITTTLKSSLGAIPERRPRLGERPTLGTLQSIAVPGRTPATANRVPLSRCRTELFSQNNGLHFKHVPMGLQAADAWRTTSLFILNKKSIGANLPQHSQMCFCCFTRVFPDKPYCQYRGNTCPGPQSAAICSGTTRVARTPVDAISTQWYAAPHSMRSHGVHHFLNRNYSSYIP